METFALPPNAYSAACPARQVLDLIADKWSIFIISSLESRSLRFAELERQIGGISQKMLTQTLRNLERDGLVQRTVYPEVPPRVEYALTPLGRTICMPLAEIIRWSEENITAVMAAQQNYDERATKGFTKK
ncbi:MAG TPA: helix-turn-helix domain-containing protein [Ktedonobacteraceae bacterium]|nr:helix-turn-helix domain-containing protein [Ktedonobacteraceae bacterium]